MKLNKINFKFPTIILYFTFLLLIDKIFDFIPKEVIDLFIIILGIANFIFFLFEVYSVITKKQSTKIIYIVLVDILIIIDWAVLLYLCFMNYDKNNIEVILEISRNGMIAYMLFLVLMLARGLLKSDELI